MQPRKYMIDFRRQHNISREDMAKKLQISDKLLGMIEDNDQEVTHPGIAKAIARAYKLTKAQRITMLPLNHRPGPDYGPDRYKLPPELDGINFYGGNRAK